MFSLLRWMAAGVILGILVLVALYLYLERFLPPVDSLEEYRPDVITEVFSDDGTLLAEFASQRMREVPEEEIPEHVKKVFVAAEDHRFWYHRGVDPLGILRAIYHNFRAGEGRRQGASTITMQVARTFFLSHEPTYRRKIKEALLALKIETLLPKDRILYLYLNRVDFGRGCYGIGAAAEYYFGKPAQQLTLAEAAMLAGMLPAPSRYNPVNNFEFAKKKQKVVLDKMASPQVGEELRLSKEEAEAAFAQQIEVHGEKGPTGEAAPYFTEQVRRILVERYGADRVYREGLKVFTTVNIKADEAARKAIQKKILGEGGLDRALGFRRDKGKRVSSEEIEKELARLESQNLKIWKQKKLKEARSSGEVDKVNAEHPDPAPLLPGKTYEALVSRVDDGSETVWVLLGHSRGRLEKKELAWAKKYVRKNRDGTVSTRWAARISEVLSPGDLIQVEVLSRAEEADGADGAVYLLRLTQEPVIQAGLIALSTRTGHVKALAGGVDFRQSQYIRPVQAHRQPGSAMKPLIYAAALDDPAGRYNTASVLLDSAVTFVKGQRNPRCPDDPPIWQPYSPENYDGNFLGYMTLRRALAESRNCVAVKTAWDICLSRVVEYAHLLGIKSQLDLLPCLPLGCSEVTLEELATAYNVFASGGYLLEPVYITRVYDREGRLLEYEKILPSAEPVALSKAEAKSSSDKSRAAPGGFTEEDLTEERVKPPPQLANHYFFLDNPRRPEEVGEPTWEQYLAELRSPEHPWLPPLETPAQGWSVISPQTAFIMTDLLTSVIKEGTARQAGQRFKIPLAGKTGTTNSYRDALFIGYSPELLAAVWVGPDDYAYSLGRGGTGAGAALPIWMDFMEAVLAGHPAKDFPQPPGIKWITVCLRSGLLATSYCEQTVTAPFKEGTEPTVSCLCKPAEADETIDPLHIDRFDASEAESRYANE